MIEVTVINKEMWKGQSILRGKSSRNETVKYFSILHLHLPALLTAGLCYTDHTNKMQFVPNSTFAYINACYLQEELLWKSGTQWEKISPLNNSILCVVQKMVKGLFFCLQSFWKEQCNFFLLRPHLREQNNFNFVITLN